MKLTKKNQLCHGMIVKCKIEGEQIDDARISIDSKGQTYICQNKKDGTDAPNKLEYKYSWIFTHDGKSGWLQYVTDLESIKKTFKDLEWGDYILMNGKKKKVLGRLCDLVFLSSPEGEDNWDSEVDKYPYTWQELLRHDTAIIEEPVEQIVELTLQEIADMKGIPVENLRIKE